MQLFYPFLKNTYLFKIFYEFKIIQYWTELITLHFKERNFFEGSVPMAFPSSVQHLGVHMS